MQLLGTIGYIYTLTGLIAFTSTVIRRAPDVPLSPEDSLSSQVAFIFRPALRDGLLWPVELILLAAHSSRLLFTNRKQTNA